MTCIWLLMAKCTLNAFKCNLKELITKTVPLRGGSWLGCGVVPAMGALFNLGAGCQKWKPLDIPGTQHPSSDAVVKDTMVNSGYST